MRLAHLFELQLESIAEPFQLGFDAAERGIGYAKKKVFKRIPGSREESENGVEVDREPLSPHEAFYQLGDALIKVRPVCNIVFRTITDGRIGLRGELPQISKVGRGRVPIYRKIALGKPCRVVALLRVIQSRSQAAVLHCAFDEHRRPIG